MGWFFSGLVVGIIIGVIVTLYVMVGPERSEDMDDMG